MKKIRLRKKTKRKLLALFILILLIMSIVMLVSFLTTPKNKDEKPKEKETKLKTIAYDDLNKKINNAYDVILDNAKEDVIRKYVDELKKYNVSKKEFSCLKKRIDLLELVNKKYDKANYSKVVNEVFNTCQLDKTNKDKTFIIASIIEEQKSIKEKEIALTFIGDTSFGTFLQAKPERMFDYVYEQNGSDKNYVFKYVKPWFVNDNLTIVNSETAFTNRTEHKNKEWIIPSKPEHAEFYKLANIELANLANNHTRDYYDSGFEDTKKALDTYGIKYFDDGSSYKIKLKGKEIVFLAYDVRHLMTSEQVIQRIESEIKTNKTKDNLVIVNMHWGIEYNQPVAYQKEYGHRIIDAGADLLIGHHPHMLQGIENYKDKYILYSLGDFAFGGDPDQESRDTNIFRLYYNLETNKMRLKLVPCYENSDGKVGVNNFQPLPLYGEESKQIINHMIEISDLLEYGVKEIDYFNIE